MDIPIIDKKTVFHINNNEKDLAKEFLEMHGINNGEQSITI